MRVVVCGSYRPKETQYKVGVGRWDEYRRAAQNLGAALAQAGHTLLAEWSYANWLSQLGAKDRVNGNPKSHPYWETADYHALVGFLRALGSRSRAASNARVILHVNSNEDAPKFLYPFVTPTILSRVDGLIPAEKRSGTPFQLFAKADRIDIRPYVDRDIVAVDRATFAATQMRQDMLEGLALAADAVIVMGGGKATAKAVSIARERRAIVSLAATNKHSPFSSVDRDCLRGFHNLQAKLAELAAKTKGGLPGLARRIPKALPDLISSEVIPKFIVVTIRIDEFNGVFDNVMGRVNDHGTWEGEHSHLSTGYVEHRTRGLLKIGVARLSEQGQGEAQKVVENVIKDADPRLIVLCGIGGGTPTSDYTLGDVVVSNRVHDFTVGARKTGGKTELTNQGGPLTEKVKAMVAGLPGRAKAMSAWNQRRSTGVAPPLAKQAPRTYGSEEWQKKVRESLDKHFFANKNGATVPRRAKPLMWVGSIAGDGYLLKDDDAVSRWKQAARDFDAIDMEFAGAYRASRQMRKIYDLVAIRGISDIVGLDRDPAWTAYAARSAGSFCCELLRNLPESFFD
jgi:nucleoside phosphorylase